MPRRNTRAIRQNHSRAHVREQALRMKKTRRARLRRESPRTDFYINLADDREAWQLPYLPGELWPAMREAYLRYGTVIPYSQVSAGLGRHFNKWEYTYLAQLDQRYSYRRFDYEPEYNIPDYHYSRRATRAFYMRREDIEPGLQDYLDGEELCVRATRIRTRATIHDRFAGGNAMGW